jgi:hypothetical protein
MVKRIVSNFIHTNYIARFGSNNLLLLFTLIIITLALSIFGRNYSINSARASETIVENQVFHSYIPLVYKINNLVVPSIVPKVNIPKIENDQGDFLPEEAAIFWFGKVTPAENYADVRIGYFQSSLWIWVSVIDRRLWYDESPTPEELTKWDSASLFLNVDGNGDIFTLDNTYRFDAQLNWWEDRSNWQAGYQASDEGWSIIPIDFDTHTNWWSFSAPNEDADARAWLVEYIIPFTSLGLSSPPPEGTEWRLGLQLHDRDDFAGTPIQDKVWPASIIPDQPITWGTIHYGLPGYTPPQALNPQTYTIRNGLNGLLVTDGMVGGDTVCGDGLDYWSEWGNKSYPGSRHLNIQNQGNTDDWPCFSKTYITFPLDSLPRGAEVISATLTLHQLGNASGWDNPNSLIQVWEINQDWDPATLSWNNAPEFSENLSRAWVGAIDESQLGIARYLDVSLAVSRAYAAGEPLRLALYSADFTIGSGKYFFSSSSEDWDGAWRPSLEITLGNP